MDMQKPPDLASPAYIPTSLFRYVNAQGNVMF